MIWVKALMISIALVCLVALTIIGFIAGLRYALFLYVTWLKAIGFPSTLGDWLQSDWGWYVLIGLKVLGFSFILGNLTVAVKQCLTKRSE